VKISVDPDRANWRTWTNIDWSDIQIAFLDIDGVLADTRHRDHHVQTSPKQWGAYFAGMKRDDVWEPGLQLYCDLVEEGVEIVYLTGRNENYRAITLDWLLKAGFGLQWELKMRPIRVRDPLHELKTSTVKDHLYRRDNERPLPLADRVFNNWARAYTPAASALVIDDDPKVIEALHEFGTRTFQTTWQVKVKELVDTKTT
jgi:hypothetical protein